MTPEFEIDWDRARRTGVPEAVLCDPKTPDQVAAIIDAAAGRPLLLTRLSQSAFAALPPRHQAALDYDVASRTAILGVATTSGPPRVAIVCGGTSDLPVAREAARTLAFSGVGSSVFTDVGVAGLWRLMSRLDEILGHEAVIAVAGMEGALFSVLAGLVDLPVVAVPTSVGYGVSQGGRVALDSALASCAPGLVAVNVDNGFGAAQAVLRVLGRPRRERQALMACNGGTSASPSDSPVHAVARDPPHIA